MSDAAGAPKRVLRSRAALLVLAAIVALSTTVAGVWLVRVPIFGSPDENTHVDYALAIWSAGRPISAMEQPLGTDVAPATRALARAGDFDTVRFNATGHLEAGYGTAAYFRAVDAASRPDRSWYARTNAIPYIAASYPPGFYTLEAAVFGLANALTGSLVFSFFAMRGFCLALLVATLCASYAVLREMHVKRARSLVLVATIGLFPTIDWSFAYVQPDDLGLLLADVALLLVLRARRLGATAARTLAIALTLGALASVKTYICLAVGIAIVPIAAFALARRGGARAVSAGLLAIVLAPALVTVAAGRLQIHAATTHDYAHFAKDFAARPPLETMAEGSRIARNSLNDLFGAGGTARAEYYHDFSWMVTPISLGSKAANDLADALLSAGTIAVVALVALRVVRALRAAARIAERSRSRALRLLTGDPVWNLYVVYVCILVGSIVYVDDVIHVHGRYLLVTTLGALLCATRYGPSSLPARFKRGTGTAFASALLAYSVAGACFGIAAIQHRFYGPPVAGEPTEYGIRLLGFKVDGTVGKKVAEVMPARGTIHGFGWAFDSHRTTTTTVGAVIDGRIPLRVRNGLPSPDEVDHTNDTRLRNGGFDFTLDAATLAPGPHTLSFYTVEAGRRVAYAGAPNGFTVSPSARGATP